MKPAMHASVNSPVGVVSLEDLREEDVEECAAYFHRPDAHLDTLMDRARVGTMEQTCALFRAMIRTGDPAQMRIGFSIRLNGRLIGQTNLVRKTPDVNYSHWHIMDESLRGAGFSTLLYPHRIKVYFDLYPIARLIHQTKPSNVGVNRMLDRYVPVAGTDYVEHPDGFAKPGLHHHRYVTRADIPRLFETAARLRAGAS
jgi:hypothetical protein